MKKGILYASILLVFLRAASGETDRGRWAILIFGLSGNPELQKDFLMWAQKLHESLAGPLQFARDQIFILFDDPSKGPDFLSHRSTRETLEKLCREIGGRTQKDDLVFVFIAGHGGFDSKGYKLNLPGPDPTAEELAAALYSIPAQRFVVVNTTTCSGASVPALAGKGRIIVSATKSGHEKNQTHMGQYFVEALGSGNADVDKNGRISILEAFDYAARKVEEFYTKEGNLQTEHPVLEDDGDGQAHAKPGPDNGDGFLARTTYLDAGSVLLTQGKLSAEEVALVREAEALEKQIEALKYAKSGMAEAQYEKELETLLLKLAKINAKLRKK